MADSVEFKEFLTYYGKLTKVVEKTRVNPLLQTPGILQTTLSLFRYTPYCKNSDDAVVVEMAHNGMKLHLQTLECEIRGIYEKLKKPTKEKKDFGGFLSKYKKIIVQLDKDRTDSQSRKNQEKLRNSLSMIDEFCSTIIKLSITSKNFIIEWYAVCGIVEHMGIVRSDINELLQISIFNISIFGLHFNFEIPSFVPKWFIHAIKFLLKVTNIFSIRYFNLPIITSITYMLSNVKTEKKAASDEGSVVPLQNAVSPAMKLIKEIPQIMNIWYSKKSFMQKIKQCCEILNKFDKNELLELYEYLRYGFN